MIHFDDSSKLSRQLNLRVISPKSVYYELKKYEAEVCANESTYWLFFELLWRDYFKFFSLKFGPEIFLAKGLGEGKTPEAFINANMNKLNLTGQMSNRGRQNVASYLIQDLGVSWTWGASYFEEKLLDYDPDLNWENWPYLS